MRVTQYPDPVGSRIFAFLAVGIAIAAVAWATRDPSLLAVGIPGLAAGHFYSWRWRGAISTARTLTLFFLMLLLTIYLGRELFLYRVGDRVFIARYLIYGVVLGSFDLMRGKNLAASLVVGALLLVLISELALNLWFLVFAIVFAVLALVAVALGRIDSEKDQAILVGEFNWLTAGKFWMGFTISTLLVASLFFLLMPRLASSQVTQASWLPSRLDLSLGRLTMLPSKPTASVSPGIFPSLQDGGIPSGEHVTLGYVGSPADQPVMHVRSRISSYWRGLTLDKYDGQGWLNSSPQIKLFNENRREFVLPDSSVSLSGERAYWQAYYLLSDQPNAIFTGYKPGRIYLPEGFQAFLEKGTLYRALSSVPYLIPGLLRNDSVAPEDVSNLTLPPISERTTSLAESIVQGAPTDYDKAARLERFLFTNYPYELNVEPLPPGHDAVDFFLFEQQEGYCSHFATTMAVMARHVGLPARVAAGYLPGFIDPMTGAHIVRAGDAHAWVEIHFRRHGWVAFDPTPRSDATSGFAAARNWVYFGLEDFTGVTFSSMLSPLAGNFSFGSLSVPGWAWGALFGMVIAVTVLVLLISQRKVRVRQEVKRYSALDGEPRRTMLNLYSKMVGLLVRNNLPSRQPHEPPYEYSAIISSQIPDGQEIIEWLSHAASSAAYDPRPFNPETVPEARLKLSALRRALVSRR
ncbi:DUF3488 and DUF4129 domain-containing transglutaminase family protein [Chloroflexota bacterium]